MSADEQPHRRTGVDSADAARRPVEPADRHALRLGVLGYVECGRGSVAYTTSKAQAAGGLKSGRHSLAASVLFFPMIAAE